MQKKLRQVGDGGGGGTIMAQTDLELVLQRCGLVLPTTNLDKFILLLTQSRVAITRSKSSPSNHQVLENVFACTAMLLASHQAFIPSSLIFSPEPAFTFTVMLAFVSQLRVVGDTVLLRQLYGELERDGFDMELSEYFAFVEHAAVASIDALQALQAFMYNSLLGSSPLAICTTQQKLASVNLRVPMRDLSVLFATRFLEYYMDTQIGLVRTAIILAGCRPIAFQQCDCVPTTVDDDLLKCFLHQLQRFDPTIVQELDRAFRLHRNDQPQLYLAIRIVINSTLSGEERRSRLLFALDDFTKWAINTNPYRGDKDKEEEKGQVGI
ncbi:hypothetical protein BASA81_003776 [Batrachochytrium salamandrivorans]|nr:hypothetical protein BASA81_003776 [Batrachochytrium salamandrivorans]